MATVVAAGFVVFAEPAHELRTLTADECGIKFRLFKYDYPQQHVHGFPGVDGTGGGGMFLAAVFRIKTSGRRLEDSFDTTSPIAS